MSALTHPPTTSALLLMGMRQSELDGLFSCLPVPHATTLSGAWSGRLMALSGTSWWPRVVSRAVWRALGWPLLNPWRGKAFEGEDGANQWFGLPGFRFGHYRVQESVAADDGHPCLQLDYDVDTNPFWLRPIRGEARVWGQDRLLCRMNWQGRYAQHRVLYFTLQKVV